MEQDWDPGSLLLTSPPFSFCAPHQAWALTEFSRKTVLLMNLKSAPGTLKLGGWAGDCVLGEEGGLRAGRDEGWGGPWASVSGLLCVPCGDGTPGR